MGLMNIMTTSKAERPKLNPTQVDKIDVLAMTGLDERQLRQAQDYLGFPRGTTTMWDPPGAASPRFVPVWMKRDVERWMETFHTLASVVKH